VNEEALAHWVGGGDCQAKGKEEKDILVGGQARQDCLTLKMEALRSFYTSYQSTRGNSLKHWTFDSEVTNILVCKYFWAKLKKKITWALLLSHENFYVPCH